MPALPLIVPAVAAGIAYLNARHGISYDISLLSAGGRSAVNGALNERRDRLNLFYELESHATSNRSNNTWIVFQGQTWTYAQAYDIVLRYGAWLKSQGVEKDEIVAIDFVNSDAFIWFWFGLWSIGAKPAFINYNLTGKSLVHTIETSTARLVIVDEAGRDKFSKEVMKEHGFTRLQEQKYSFETDAGALRQAVRNQTTVPHPLEAARIETKVQRQFQIIHFDRTLESHIFTFPPTRQLDSIRANQTRSSMAMLIYTSGTTGLPKPAVMSWGKASMGSRLMSSWLGVNADDVVYTSMPLYHSSASVLGVCTALNAGSAICISAKFSHKTFWLEVHASNATIIHYVGETCRYLLSAPASPLDKKHNLRAAYGNGLRPDVWEPFKERFNIPTIYEFYAATESPGGLFNRSSNAFSSGAIGRSGTLASLLFSSGLALVRLDTSTSPPTPIRNPSTHLCLLADPNEPGELLFALDPHNIPRKFQGYFNNPSANDSKILRNVKRKGDAWYRSGDVLRRDTQGRWWWVDRVGDTFRWKAENVSTAEVAQVLGKLDAIQEACVYGVQVPGHDGRAGCAAVVLKQGKDTSMDEVLNGLAQHVVKELPGFARPIWIRVTRELDTTGTMKVQKQGLQEEGIDLGVVEGRGDVLFWLREGKYVRFMRKDWERVQGGGVKL
ncbi:acetyl-CoA synthetase-like protein [Ophiobolus disseminans]|uniref:Acetyl-CoA synthetase-like protein n=1 Tax=Ophiobolus disseminans TaxID=1469910 RepID=A0A6A6ZT17_9PLEO|nr:acetyl-CoA synthetase-like protein [Ophiobolus disseminans]